MRFAPDPACPGRRSLAFSLCKAVPACRPVPRRTSGVPYHLHGHTGRITRTRTIAHTGPGALTCWPRFRKRSAASGAFPLFQRQRAVTSSSPDSVPCSADQRHSECNVSISPPYRLKRRTVTDRHFQLAGSLAANSGLASYFSAPDSSPRTRAVRTALPIYPTACRNRHVILPDLPVSAGS
ncbi:hypothetical protein OFAG_02309 [Oxalobacter formigenes HOxBLS]|uniref:Uncharacterized protein n=1 Tax=Oxalobacter paraformigenes TaxID=556268 RepID=T5LE59_9BURK|nr:hypothetical protein OFAG_02309 [Oxalobacter paraformigenes]